MAGKRAKVVCSNVFRHKEKPDKDELARIVKALIARRETYAGAHVAGMSVPRKGGA